MANDITLIDRGRGMQLSSSRITVMDLVPYFQEGCTHEEIIRWVPTLTPREIAIVESYYQEHKKELDEEERRVMEYREEQMRLQRLRFPRKDETKEEFISRVRKLLHTRRQETNGEGDSR